jgi:hypothetical protein
MVKEKKPGTFDDGMTSDDDYEKFFEERRNADQTKIKLIDNLKKQRKISSQFADFLLGVQTSTFDSQQATLRKIKAILSLREVLKNYGIKEKHALYIGSGYDWRFPIALGARDIVMLDIDSSRSDLKEELFKNIQTFDPKAKTKIENNPVIELSFDIGEGLETARLELVTSDVAEYHPEKPVDFVLEFAGPTKNSNRSRVPVLTNIAAAMSSDALVFNSDYDHIHKTLYDPSIGMKEIDLSGFHVYQVSDRNQMILSSSEIFLPPQPSLDRLRTIVKSHKKK